MMAGLLNHAGYRYLWLTLLLSVASVAVYFTQSSSGAQPPNGGTWQGYALGTVAALLIVWLSLLGIRKRRYRSRLGSVRGWASAHVYLGLSLLLIASLHSAFQVGINIHTLAYALMILVVVSGIYGVYAYAALPSRVASNAAGKDVSVWAKELAEVDRDILSTSSRGDARLQSQVASALELTSIGGGSWSRLRGADRSRIRMGDAKTVGNRDQQTIINHLASAVPDASRRREVELLNNLLDAFGRRQVLLRRLRRDMRLAALLRVWLYFHVPLTAALLAALMVHIITVFLYW